MPLSSGLATLTTELFAAGLTAVTTVYSGDPNYQTSTAGPLQVAGPTIEKPQTLGITANSDGTITVSFAGTPGAQ